jgi:hypothetical protein
MLLEHEIWDKLCDTLKSAIAHCGQLATFPAQGPTYLAIIVELELIEGASRQMGFNRGDARWSLFGYEIHHFRRRIGDALRAHNNREIFLFFKGMMEGALADAVKMKDARTGRRGLILPKAKPGPHRETRPVYVSPGGLLVPAGHA